MSITAANVHTIQTTNQGTVRVVESGSVVTVLSPLSSTADKTTLIALLANPALGMAVQREGVKSLNLVNNVGFTGNHSY